MTVVFDAGQNSAANYAPLAGTILHYVGSVPASDTRELVAITDAARPSSMRPGTGVTACDTRRDIYGDRRRAIYPLHRTCTPNNPAGSTRPWPRPAAA